jgi:hypothetical protein
MPTAGAHDMNIITPKRTQRHDHAQERQSDVMLRTVVEQAPTSSAFATSMRATLREPLPADRGRASHCDRYPTNETTELPQRLPVD